MKKILFLFLLALGIPFATIAQKGGYIVIKTAHTGLVFHEEKDGSLHQIYYGQALKNPADYYLLPGTRDEAYPTFGTKYLFTPAIRTVHNDGNPSLALVYKSHQQLLVAPGVEETTIHLHDPKYPVEVDLHFKAYLSSDVIAQWVTVSHHEKKPIVLYQYASAALSVSASNYTLEHFHGDWAAEMQMESTNLTAGKKTLSSQLETRAHMYQSPSFLISLNGTSTEEYGDVIGGTLAWSGNFKLDFEVDEINQLRILAGMNELGAEYHLLPGKTFTTPAFLFSYSNEGKGLISRNFHKWARDYGVLNGHGSRYTLLNNWEATYFDFNEEKLTNLFDDAKQLGVDLFLLDDGWFGNKYPRNNDRAGLGDWQENKAKLPHGIGYLVKEAAARDLKFGIWLEPEMVNPKSELYEKHPEWIIKLPNREEHYYRSQLVLDLTNPTVQDFVYHIVDDMMSKNPGIAYIKWDCNRMVTNAYSQFEGNQQSNLYVDYVNGLYKVLDRVRQKYPELPIMLCSGGGGRVDYGALPYFTEFWPSDNTGATERVFIQWGYSYFFPSIATSAHVTEWGDAPLKFRLAVSMAGRLGFDLVPKKLNAEELALCQQALHEYKAIQQTVWQGDLYRLQSPYDHNVASWMYAANDKAEAVIFMFRIKKLFDSKIAENIKFKGLDPGKKYLVKELLVQQGQKAINKANGKTYSGDYLMKVGLPSNLNKVQQAVILQLKSL
ncbi:alpha-galactosidase [Chitinophaga caeni]|uniref:Alpha-galactosidase n=1 Tax=Chitinophaga caeni TaxID=2029983 RepID=A0A291QR46_9BACT|nr:alpha-galactosidase [Chitinophaga caeni]ATL46406.1 alpha-galactosidase [Chitinophaga caeni]